MVKRADPRVFLIANTHVCVFGVQAAGEPWKNPTQFSRRTYSVHRLTATSQTTEPRKENHTYTTGQY